MLAFMSAAEGDVITQEGAEDDGIYILIDGSVKVTASSKSGDTVFLGTMHQYDIMGEICLLTSGRRTATLTANEPCRFLHMSRDRCKTLLAQTPELMNDLGE
jgi:CRP/FNR family cyclic AMP-dependent transcriptional regulator